MITATNNRNVESNVIGGGDSRQFGMDLDGKAFRILFDGIYSNKIGTPIREYLANAYDSHVVAGCADVPVSVTLPTVLDPTFTIRDFGIGLSHDSVMELYSTMFRSTKNGSNAEVGAFGLGSKSAFAYTDTFVISSYHGGRKRVYHAVIGTDDIPTITEFVELSEDSDETGFEVSIPVQLHDVQLFIDEFRRVAEGFDVKPSCNLDITFDEPVLAGDGWRLFPSSNYSASLAIRQGCVVYPVAFRDFDSNGFISHDMRYHRLVVDLPIGSAEVAVSREALAFDARTKANVLQAVTKAFNEVLDAAKSAVEAAPTFIDAMRARKSLNRMFPGCGNGMTWRNMALYDDMYFRDMHFSLIGARGATEHWKNARFDIDNAKHKHYIVDRGQHLIRRRLRLNDIKNTLGQSNVVIIDNPTNKQLSRFIRLLDIPSSNIRSIVAIPDVEVAPRSPSGSSDRPKATGVYSASRLRVHEPPQSVDSWLPLSRGNSTMESYAFGYHAPADGLHSYLEVAESFGMDSQVFLLTPAAQKRYNVDSSTRFDMVLDKLLVDNEQSILDGVYNITLKSSCSKLGNQYNILGETDSLRDGNETVASLLLGNRGSWNVRRWLTGRIADVKIEAAKEAAEFRNSVLAKTFPLLFDLGDDEAMTEYINSRKGNLK